MCKEVLRQNIGSECGLFVISCISFKKENLKINSKKEFAKVSRDKGLENPKILGLEGLKVATPSAWALE